MKILKIYDFYLIYFNSKFQNNESRKFFIETNGTQKTRYVGMFYVFKLGTLYFKTSSKYGMIRYLNCITQTSLF